MRQLVILNSMRFVHFPRNDDTILEGNARSWSSSRSSVAVVVRSHRHISKRAWFDAFPPRARSNSHPPTCPRTRPHRPKPARPPRAPPAKRAGLPDRVHNREVCSRDILYHDAKRPTARPPRNLGSNCPSASCWLAGVCSLPFRRTTVASTSRLAVVDPMAVFVDRGEEGAATVVDGNRRRRQRRALSCRRAAPQRSDERWRCGR